MVTMTTLLTVVTMVSVVPCFTCIYTHPLSFLNADLQQTDQLATDKHSPGGSAASPRAGNAETPTHTGEIQTDKDSDRLSKISEGSVTCDKLLGDKLSGDKSSGDKSSGDKSSGDKSSGDKSSGDKLFGDKSSGDELPGGLPGDSDILKGNNSELRSQDDVSQPTISDWAISDRPISDRPISDRPIVILNAGSVKAAGDADGHISMVTDDKTSGVCRDLQVRNNTSFGIIPVWLCSAQHTVTIHLVNLHTVDNFCTTTFLQHKVINLQCKIF